MWFSVEGNGHYNQILLGILTDATDSEDRLYDAVKFRGNHNISLSAFNEGRDYAIMAFPPPHAEKSIPLTVFLEEPGTYTFRANVMENFQYQNVFFVDTKTSQAVELHQGTEVSMYLDGGTYEGRFYLNFYPDGFVGLPETDENTFQIYSNDDVLYLFSTDALNENVPIEVFDLGGRLVLNSFSLLSNGSGTLSLVGITDGIYVVRVASKHGPIVQKIFKQ